MKNPFLSLLILLTAFTLSCNNAPVDDGSGDTSDQFRDVMEHAKKEAARIVTEAREDAKLTARTAEADAKRADAVDGAKLEVLTEAHEEVVEAQQATIEQLSGIITTLIGKLPEVNLDSFQVINNIPASQQKQGKDKKKD